MYDFHPKRGTVPKLHTLSFDENQKHGESHEVQTAELQIECWSAQGLRLRVYGKESLLSPVLWRPQLSFKTSAKYRGLNN